MRVLELGLKNIGPFDEARVEFLSRDRATEPGVTLLTGMNGTGKTILLDAIRGFFGKPYGELERDIWRPGTAFEVEVVHSFHTNTDTAIVSHRSNELLPTRSFSFPAANLYSIPSWVANNEWPPPPWVVDFWRSQLATDHYHIQALTAFKHRELYQGSLQGTVSNADVTQLLCHLDYLRDSRDPGEKLVGEVLFALAEKIIKFSLLDGELIGIERLTFTPKVRQGGHEVPLGSISSGNAYLAQRMLSLLGRMYSLHVLRGGDPAEIHRTPGLLLIDEAENHLHPVWQKKFLPGIREIFPNLQIIAATHSPFILASVPDARVYVCHYDPASRRSLVTEETEAYQNKPVDEILASPAFDGTLPFGPEITELLRSRKEAIKANDGPKRLAIEGELERRNPTYFSYLTIDRQLNELGRPADGSARAGGAAANTSRKGGRVEPTLPRRLPGREEAAPAQRSLRPPRGSHRARANEPRQVLLLRAKNARERSRGRPSRRSRRAPRSGVHVVEPLSRVRAMQRTKG
jgi:predicted ATPase